MSTQPTLDHQALSDAGLAARIAARDLGAVRQVTAANNQRLFRAAWSILGNRADAEDAVQSAYLRAFTAIESFEGRSSLSTWLTRIVINEALGRVRAARRREARLDGGSIIHLAEYRDKLMRGSSGDADPDRALERSQLRQMLERAIAALPETFRTVFILREVEGMSVEEVADSLGIPASTVKTRHLRARRRLRDALEPELRLALDGALPFAGVDCEALTARVEQAVALAWSASRT